MSEKKTAYSKPEILAETVPPQTEKLMYIGPTTIKTVPLTHRSIFTGLPTFLEKQPAEIKGVLADCFVPLNQAAAALRELEWGTANGPVIAKYKKAQSLLRSAK